MKGRPTSLGGITLTVSFDGPPSAFLLKCPDFGTSLALRNPISGRLFSRMSRF
jgi:hypothetical protein